MTGSYSNCTIEEVKFSTPVLALVVSAYLGLNHETPGISLVDTGANVYVSKMRSDFVSLSDETTPISGTSGKIQGTVGSLRRNHFSLTKGIFIAGPSFPLGRIPPFYRRRGARK